MCQDGLFLLWASSYHFLSSATPQRRIFLKRDLSQCDLNPSWKPRLRPFWPASFSVSWSLKLKSHLATTLTRCGCSWVTYGRRGKYGNSFSHTKNKSLLLRGIVKLNSLLFVRGFAIRRCKMLLKYSVLLLSAYWLPLLTACSDMSLLLISHHNIEEFIYIRNILILLRLQPRQRASVFCLATTVIWGWSDVVKHFEILDKGWFIS